MPPRRRIRVTDGESALRAWRESGGTVERSMLATAVRYALEELAVRHPGRSVEVRVPPFGAAQPGDFSPTPAGTPFRVAV